MENVYFVSKAPMFKNHGVVDASIYILPSLVLQAPDRRAIITHVGTYDVRPELRITKSDEWRPISFLLFTIRLIFQPPAPSSSTYK